MRKKEEKVRTMKKYKKLIIFFSVVAVLALSVAFIMVHHWYIPHINDSFSISAHTSHQPEMISHRGLSSMAPENTIPAVELSVEYGYDGCEFDIHTTKDGKWVVIHNESVEDMTDGEGMVADYTLEEIRKLKIDGGEGFENYKDLQIPTLDEVLEKLEGTETAPIVEIKNCDTKYLPDLKAALEKYNLSEKANIISFKREYLEEYKKLDGDAKLQLLVSKISEDDINWCVENGVDTVSFHFLSFYKSIKGWLAARKNGITLAAWTVDNTVFKDVMVLIGAKKITTNQLIVNK